MKKFPGFVLFMLFGQIAFAQNAYIQVNGEPGLSVYLNDQFKGKTTVEFNGCIIENVTPGRNSIRIVKEGFAPYEEAIIVKAGEVFAYKVKPFSKHAVYISENGSSDETDKKQILATGTLVVQSLPIEIKITIPAISGVTNRQKSKDEWMVEEIPVGTYKVSFSYNQKNIESEVEIKKNTASSIFVNMLNGELTVKYTALVDKEMEKLKKEQAEREEIRRRKELEMQRQFERRQ